MPSAGQILDAFKKAESRERIELMVEMFRYLTPTEMRFVLTYLEDLAANSLRTYQRVESEANDCKRLSSLTRPEATLDEIIGQAVLFTSFLRKDNINGARLMTRILEEIVRRVESTSCVPEGELGTKNADQELPPIGDVLLLFSMASHHSAFSFNSRFELHAHLKRLQRMFNQPDERLGSEQSLAGFSRFPSLESVELGVEFSTIPSMASTLSSSSSSSSSSSTNQNGASSESNENNQNNSSEKITEGSIPQHLVSSPRNTYIEFSDPQPSTTSVKVTQVVKVIPAGGPMPIATSSQSSEIQSHDSCKESSDRRTSETARVVPKPEVQDRRRSSGRVVCIEAKVLEDICESQSQDQSTEKLGEANHNFDMKSTSYERPSDLWSQSVSKKATPTTNGISNPQSPAESATPSISRPQISSLFDKLISSNFLNDDEVEFAKEKRRSLGGNQKPLLPFVIPEPVQNGGADASTPVLDIPVKIEAPLDSSAIENCVKDADDSCNVSQAEGELSQSFLPDLLEFKDDAAPTKPVSDRRSSMPPYLPSSLLPMFKGDEVEKGWKEQSSTRDEDNDKNSSRLLKASSCVGNKNSDGMSLANEGGSLQEKSESPVEAANSDASTSLSNSSGRSYRNTRNHFNHSRHRNGSNSTIQGGHRGLTDYQRHQPNVGGTHSDSNGHVPRNCYFKNNNGNNGRTSHGDHRSRQNNNHFNWNANFQHGRLQQLNPAVLQLQTQTKATFQQQYQQQTFHSNQQQQLQLHNQQQQQQQQSQSSGSPPGAFNLQHLNMATSVAQPAQGYYTQYFAHYPAEYAQAILNPASYYGFRSSLSTQSAIVNRASNGVLYPGNAANGNGSLRYHSSVPRGMTPSYFAQGTPLVMATFQSNNGIQSLVCSDQLNSQAPQACYFDPTIPPPPLANNPSVATYAPQVLLYDRRVTADAGGKAMCPNCASNDHSFSTCPHSLPSIPR